jgi:hypothetical protein
MQVCPVGAGRAHDRVAHGGGAGEDQVVEGQRDERLGDCGVAPDHAHLVGGEGFGQQPRQQRAEGGRVL